MQARSALGQVATVKAAKRGGSVEDFGGHGLTLPIEAALEAEDAVTPNPAFERPAGKRLLSWRLACGGGPLNLSVRPLVELTAGGICHDADVYFEIVGEVSAVETIATGSGIRELARLRKRYGRGRWRKARASRGSG